MPISWREISGSLPQWSLAGRTDTPPAGQAAGIAAFVQFASTHTNQQSANISIQRQLQSVSPEVEQRFIGGAPRVNGVFAVVTMREVRHPDGQRSLSNAVTHLYPGTYINPEIMLRRLQYSSVSGLSGDPALRIVRRYFWGVYYVQRTITRRYIGGTMLGRIGAQRFVRRGFHRR